jgi:hypothetical protein
MIKFQKILTLVLLSVLSSLMGLGPLTDSCANYSNESTSTARENSNDGRHEGFANISEQHAIPFSHAPDGITETENEIEEEDPENKKYRTNPAIGTLADALLRNIKFSEYAKIARKKSSSAQLSSTSSERGPPVIRS